MSDQARYFTQYRDGLGHVPSYQISARPFLTSSLAVPESTSDPLSVSFETVSRFIVITNTVPGTKPSAPLRFGFSENGIRGLADHNYAVLDNGESFEAEFRVTSVYLLGCSALLTSASVVAGLTGINAGALLNNWSGSAGVG